MNYVEESEVNTKLSYAQKSVITYLFLSVFLPAGGFLNINFKLILLIISVFFIVFERKGVFLYKFLKVIYFPILMILVFIFYSIILGNEIPFILSQSIQIIVFFLVLLLPLAVFNKEELVRKVIPVIVFGGVSVAIFKICMLLYSVISGQPVTAVVMLVRDFFNVNIMSYDIDDSYLGRINLPGDLLLNFSIFFIISEIIKIGFKPKKRNLLYLIVLLISALLTMSRYQWAAVVFSMMLPYFMFINNRKSLAFLFLFAFAAAITLTIPSVQDVIMSRFDSDANSASDIIRILQQNKIEGQINKSLFFGSGLGSYVKDYIRSPTQPYSYELQLLALIMQLGIVGFFVFFMYIFNFFFKHTKNASFRYLICAFILMGLWISGAIFNPTLYSSCGGAVLLVVCISSNHPYFKRRF